MKKMDATIEALITIEDLVHWLGEAEDDADPWFTEQFWELAKIKKRIKQYKEHLEYEHGPDAYAA